MAPAYAYSFDMVTERSRSWPVGPTAASAALLSVARPVARDLHIFIPPRARGVRRFSPRRAHRGARRFPTVGDARGPPIPSPAALRSRRPRPRDPVALGSRTRPPAAPFSRRAALGSRARPPAAPISRRAALGSRARPPAAPISRRAALGSRARPPAAPISRRAALGSRARPPRGPDFPSRRPGEPRAAPLCPVVAFWGPSAVPLAVPRAPSPVPPVFRVLGCGVWGWQLWGCRVCAPSPAPPPPPSPTAAAAAEGGGCVGAEV
ncbi:unnamed protein product [Closterium sp. Yama58-4]|nr:unnamed protein product [Closterium sp. Yama58-4]